MNEVICSLSAGLMSDEVNYLEFIDNDEKFTAVKSFYHIYTPQKYTWDCGLACSIMALRFLRRESVEISSIYEHHVVTTNQSRPLWTIDLFGS
jgi:hypothetical protein